LLIDLGGWSFLGAFKKNREKIEFYNKNTSILKSILDRHTEDKKLGEDLMQKRVKKEKAKNIAKYGPDAPGLATYKATRKGVPQTTISAEEMKRLEAARGDLKAARELEVIDQNKAKLRQLDDIKAYRPLSSQEQTDYKRAEEAIKHAEEMLEVPDNSIQVDVFQHDTRTGKFTKSKFYSLADDS
jgi:hypothetical protein